MLYRYFVHGTKEYKNGEEVVKILRLTTPPDDGTTWSFLHLPYHSVVSTASFIYTDIAKA
jgi:hypothetical protein